MKILSHNKCVEPEKVKPCTVVLRDGTTSAKQELLLNEHLLEVYISDVLAYRIVCSPSHLNELVLGRLLTEGIIQSTDDVESLCISDDGNKATVYLSDNVQQLLTRPVAQEVATGCTDNKTLACLSQQRQLKPVIAIEYQQQWIFALTESVNTNTPLYSSTHSSHSCILQREGKILICCEDVGRHNALDKAVGWALLNNVNLSQCILYTSGRVPVDMTKKAIRAGVGVFVSKATPTDKSVALAQKYNLTLIGSAHPDSYKIFT